jgi:hypothetical protein
MAVEWHYLKGDEEFGPVSTSELKALASSGELSPADMLWKDGMDEWKPASGLKGLFPPVSSTPEPQMSPPPLPTAMPALGRVKSASPETTSARGKTLKSSSKVAQAIVPTVESEVSLKQSLIANAKDAALFAKKQAERTRLISLTLPSLYQALGRHCFSSQDLRAEFAESFQQLDNLNSELSKIANQTHGTAKSVGEKAKAMAGKAVQAAQSKQLSLRQSYSFGTLGKRVYDKHEAQCGPPELVRPIAEALSRVATLDDEISFLSALKTGSWITPKRTAITAVVLVVFLLLIGTRYFGRSDQYTEHAPSLEVVDDTSIIVNTSANLAESSVGRATGLPKSFYIRSCRGILH